MILLDLSVEAGSLQKKFALKILISLIDQTLLTSNQQFLVSHSAHQQELSLSVHESCCSIRQTFKKQFLLFYAWYLRTKHGN